jgi:riboflavin-specific deaminase-like protein
MRPKIHAHFAITADGKISTKNLTPSQFTSPADKARLGEIRAQHDAILVGRGTVSTDTMSMRITNEKLREARTARGLSPEPLRVVISNAGKINPSWKIFEQPGPPVVILSTTRLPQKLRTKLAPLCDLHLFESPSVPLNAAFSMLRSEYGVKSLVCEGGGVLLGTLAAAGFLDEIHLTVAPTLFGGAGAPTLTGFPGHFLPTPLEFRILKMQKIGNECLLHLKRKRIRGKFDSPRNEPLV